MTTNALQDHFSPNGICFGCGPSNTEGLQIKSCVEGEHVIATWYAKPHHQAFPNVLSGGIIGTLLDCHSNWSAAWFLMQQNKSSTPPCTVTADYAVKLLRPTPTDAPIQLAAQLAEISEDRAVVTAELHAKGKLCATCRGTFVAVKPGHPAFHRW